MKGFLSFSAFYLGWPGQVQFYKKMSVSMTQVGYCLLFHEVFRVFVYFPVVDCTVQYSTVQGFCSIILKCSAFPPFLPLLLQGRRVDVNIQGKFPEYSPLVYAIRCGSLQQSSYGNFCYIVGISAFVAVWLWQLLLHCGYISFCNSVDTSAFVTVWI